MSDRVILVLGSTGTTGRRVVRQLRGAGVTVRAAARRGEVQFDWSNPTTWDGALTGVTGMYLIAPHDMPIEPAFISRAVELGVRRVVLLSSRAIEVMGDERLMAAERAVRESGIDWTVLRPDWFNQNFDEGFFRPAVLAGHVALPVGETRQVFVDADDIAAVAAVVLTGDGYAGRSYEVTGPDPLSFADAVDIISEVSGRHVRFTGDPDAYLAQQVAEGASVPDTRNAIAAFDALRNLGDQKPTDAVLRVTGRSPRDFRTYAAQAAASGRWDG